jgi:hypothetical protein
MASNQQMSSPQTASGYSAGLRVQQNRDRQGARISYPRRNKQAAQVRAGARSSEVGISQTYSRARLRPTSRKPSRDRQGVGISQTSGKPLTNVRGSDRCVNRAATARKLGATACWRKRDQRKGQQGTQSQTSVGIRASSPSPEIPRKRRSSSHHSEPRGNEDPKFTRKF